jgi:hypothetical protein
MTAAAIQPDTTWLRIPTTKSRRLIRSSPAGAGIKESVESGLPAYPDPNRDSFMIWNSRAVGPTSMCGTTTKPSI